jgi:50S ribosomal protein L16 3-hydroxylase
VHLTPAFWRSFRHRYWERRGTVLRRPHGLLLSEPAELFAWVLGCCERFRSGDRGVAPEFFVEHAQLLAGFDRYLLEPGDRSIAQYSRRVTGLLKGRRFGLVIDDFQAQAPDLWVRLRGFLSGLYEETGLPGEYAKATLFLGNYRRTPFGLHRGRCGTFMFVAHGRKRIRAWPDAFFRGKREMTNRLDYARYNSHSMKFDAGPGDIIYWPSDYWHIGEDAGGASAAISLGLFMEPDPAGDMARHVADLIGAHLGTGQARLDRGGSPARMRKGLHRAARALNAVSRDPALEIALTASRLNHLTGFGFSQVPGPERRSRLRESDLVRGDAHYPILWMRSDGELVCSANGHAFTVPAHPKVPALLRCLNRGVPVRVKGLLDAYSTTERRGSIEFVASRKDLRFLLEKLHSLRALVRLTSS